MATNDEILQELQSLNGIMSQLVEMISAQATEAEEQRQIAEIPAPMPAPTTTATQAATEPSGPGIGEQLGASVQRSGGFPAAAAAEIGKAVSTPVMAAMDMLTSEFRSLFDRMNEGLAAHKSAVERVAQVAGQYAAVGAEFDEGQAAYSLQVEGLKEERRLEKMREVRRLGARPEGVTETALTYAAGVAGVDYMAQKFNAQTFIADVRNELSATQQRQRVQEAIANDESTLRKSQMYANWNANSTTSGQQ